MSDTILNELIALSHELGHPDNDYAILGEGNTSAKVDAESFWVKASGSELRTLKPQQLVRVSFAKCRAMMATPDLTDTQVKLSLIHI